MSMDDFIPEGFAPLANWDSRNRGHNDGHSSEWKMLGDAVKNGELPGFKLSNGRWYVHRQQAEAVLAQAFEPATKKHVSSKKSAATDGIDSRHAESVCESLASIDSTLDEIYRVFSRLANAVESIATQPLARLGDVGVVETSSNGFHDTLSRPAH